MTATDGPQARLTIERHPALGSAGQHVSVDVSGLGILSLPLRPLYPNLLVTGVLGYACLGTCVFRLTSLLPNLPALPTGESSIAWPCQAADRVDHPLRLPGSRQVQDAA